MFCKNCGSQIGDNQKFCPNCGTPVQETGGSNPGAAVRGTAEDISRADITREGSRQAGVLPDL